MSGWQVAEEVKKLNKQTPVTLITGWDLQLMDNEMRDRGVDFIVNKPFQLDQVLKLVHDGMELKKQPHRKSLEK
jgi:FixJ family two-component response regulator